MLVAKGECNGTELFCANALCRTFSDKSEETDILDTLQHIADELERDLARTGFAGGCVCVKFKVSVRHNVRGYGLIALL